jgi:hypothetical protein
MIGQSEGFKYRKFLRYLRGTKSFQPSRIDEKTASFFNFLSEKERKWLPLDVSTFIKYKDKPFFLNGNVDISYYVGEFPDNIIVGGNLILYGAQMKEFPKNLTVLGDLDLSCSLILKIPEDNKVFGTVGLFGIRHKSVFRVEELKKLFPYAKGFVGSFIDEDGLYKQEIPNIKFS